MKGKEIFEESFGLKAYMMKEKKELKMEGKLMEKFKCKF